MNDEEYYSDGFSSETDKEEEHNKDFVLYDLEYHRNPLEYKKYKKQWREPYVWEWYDFDYHYKNPEDYNDHDKYVVQKISDIKQTLEQTKKSKQKQYNMKKDTYLIQKETYNIRLQNIQIGKRIDLLQKQIILMNEAQCSFSTRMKPYVKRNIIKAIQNFQIVSKYNLDYYIQTHTYPRYFDKPHEILIKINKGEI